MPNQPRGTDPNSMGGDVDRLLRQLRQLRSPGTSQAPAPPPRLRPTAPRPAVRPPGPVARPITLPSPAGVWARVGLSTVSAGALTQWPYAFCGLALTGYLAAAAVVLIAAAWAARASWRRRMGLAHIVAITVILTGATLASLQISSRLGASPVAAFWRCS